MLIEISDDTYRELAAKHHDVSAFVESTLRGLIGSPKSTTREGRSFYDVALETGLIGHDEGLPVDLSSNPAHMEGFGR